MTFVSVVIPTYNRSRSLSRVLAGLGEQTYPADGFEVVVVSDGSTDDTNDMLAELETPFRLIPILTANQGVAAARNRGVAEAGGDLILFVDDDVVPTPQLIAEHVHSHRMSEGGIVVLGPMLAPPDYEMSPWVRWEQAMLTKQYDEMLAGRWTPTARQFYTGNTSLPRRELLRFGGFDARFRRAEDVELAYRMEARGMRFLFNSQAVGHHYAERNFDSWAAIPYAYGRNDVIFAREKGQAWLLGAIFDEFHGRHFFVRGLTYACLDRPWLSRAAIALLKYAAVVAHPFGVERAANAACSGLFNLLHYQGMADELGGRKEFFEGVAAHGAQPTAAGSLTEEKVPVEA